MLRTLNLKGKTQISRDVALTGVNPKTPELCAELVAHVIHTWFLCVPQMSACRQNLKSPSQPATFAGAWTINKLCINTNLSSGISAAMPTRRPHNHKCVGSALQLPDFAGWELLEVPPRVCHTNPATLTQTNLCQDCAHASLFRCQGSLGSFRTLPMKSFRRMQCMLVSAPCLHVGGNSTAQSKLCQHALHQRIISIPPLPASFPAPFPNALIGRR